MLGITNTGMVRDLAQAACPACQEIEVFLLLFFFEIFGVNYINSWDEGSIFTLSFALIWGPVVVVCSDSPSSANLFKNCQHESALQNSDAFYHRMQTKTSELTENSYWSITENTHFVQLLIAFRNKSEASNRPFICFGSSDLFFPATDMNGEIQCLLNA